MAQLVKLFDRLPLPIRQPNLKIRGEINRGAFGVVYEGLFDGQPVAVKGLHRLLQDAAGGENALRTFCQECKRLQDLDHPHVIKYMGTFNDIDLGPVLVMERMTENLREFLERHTGKLDIQDQIRISLEITKGVTFLHHLNPPMVHRDLNDKNVMFTSEGVAKIGDFGQSKLKEDIYLTSLAPGMLTFMPPEALEDGNSKYDESLDMFSLGVLMLEIGTQQFPAPNVRGIGVISEVNRREKDLNKMETLHPLKPFILRCLNDDRKQRPKSAEMLIVLSTLEVAGIARRDDSIKRLEDMCEHLKAQAAIYKSDFEQERKDREEAAGKVAEERLRWQASIVAQNEQLEAERLKHRETLAQLEHMKENILPTMLDAEMRSRSQEKEIEELQEKSVEMQLLLSTKVENFNAKPVNLAEAQMATPVQDQQQDDSTMFNSKAKRKGSKRGSSIKQGRNYLKEEFGTIVAKKDDDILTLIEEKESLKERVETMERTLLMKCSRVRDHEHDILQLTQGTHLLDVQNELEEKHEEVKTYTGKVESKEGHDKVSEERSKGASMKSTNDGSKAPVTQDAKVNNAPSCAECGHPPWTQRCHRCPGSAEPSKIADKPAHIHKAVEVPEESQRTQASTMSRMESTNEAAGEDLPKCEKCGKIFPWNQVHLRWKHKCELPEVTQTPGRRQIHKAKGLGPARGGTLPR